MLDSDGATCLGTVYVPGCVPVRLPHYTVAMLDINECEDDNGGCSQTCTNTEGSFECSCRDGYILDGDGKNCSGTRVIYL